MGLINIFKPLSTFIKPAASIKIGNIDNYSSEFFLRVLGIKPGATGKEASMLPLRCAAHSPRYKLISLNSNQEDQLQMIEIPRSPLNTAQVQTCGIFFMKVRIYFETAATGSKTLMAKINLSTQPFWKRNYFYLNNILELILDKLYIY